MTDQRADQAEPEVGQRAAERADRQPDPGDGGETANLRARVADLEDLWRRALADLDNLRKRITRDTDVRRDDEQARLAAMWLPVLDNLDLALTHAASDPATIVAGVESVRDQALDVLRRLGYPRRADVGEPFDPARHEAVAAVSSIDAPAGTVLEVVRPRYGSDERLLRPAAVVVAKGR